MSFALRIDGQGWRSVDGPDDVGGGETYSPTPPEATIEQVRRLAWSSIKAERDRRAESGCCVDDYWYHNDVKSRTQWERMANRSAMDADDEPYCVDGSQVHWKTMSGEFVPLTAGLIRRVVAAFEIQEVAVFKAAEAHRAALMVAVDPSEYDYRAGWPPVFGE